MNSLVAFFLSYFHLLSDSAGWYQSYWLMFSWGWSQVGSHVSRGNNDYPASGKLLSLSFYHPTSLSTDQLITWYFFWYGLFQLEFLLLTWELKRKPLLRQVQAHISFIAGSRLLTEISSSFCCVTAWNERIKSQGWNFKCCSQDENISFVSKSEHRSPKNLLPMENELFECICSDLPFSQSPFPQNWVKSQYSLCK